MRGVEERRKRMEDESRGEKRRGEKRSGEECCLDPMEWRHEVT